MLVGEYTSIRLAREWKDIDKSFVGTVLATDMSWHFEWVERFGRAMKERRAQLSSGGVPEAPDLVVNSSGDEWVLEKENPEDHPVDERSQEEIDKEDRLFLCQALMKCGDISNPVSGLLVFCTSIADWDILE
jgi:hypothetical protein